MAVNDGESDLVDSFFSTGPEPEAVPEPEATAETEPTLTAEQWASELEQTAGEPDWSGGEELTPELDPYDPNFAQAIEGMVDEEIAERLAPYAGDETVEAWWQDRQARKQVAQEQEGQRLWDANEALIESSIEENRRVHDAGRDTDIRSVLPAAAEAVYETLQQEGYSAEDALELIQNADKGTLVALTTGAAAAAARDNEIKNYWLKRV